MNLNLLPWQAEFFFKSDKRRKLLHKGRRLGFTQGAAYYVIVSALQGKYKKILWGDTVASNISAYISRYFIPTLKHLPGLHDYKKQEKLLRIKDTVIDFRSADRPENWEGFGYDLVILNEAGIILKDAYLWDNAVRPMLLDNPNSVAIIGGTPKGKYYKGQIHKFWELVQQGYSDPDTLVAQYSTYDNPMISEDEIKQMEQELPESVVSQEIYGEFLDIDEAVLINMMIIKEATQRESLPFEMLRNSEPVILGIDVGWSVDPTGWCVRCGNLVHDYNFISPRRNDRLTAEELIDIIRHYEPDHIVMDQGYATGVESLLVSAGYNPMLVPFGSRAQDKAKYANKRVEMYDRLRKAISDKLVLPDEPGLHQALSSMSIISSARGLMQLEPKDKIKERLGDGAKWLNVADALALTFAYDWGAKQPYDTRPLTTLGYNDGYRQLHN